MTTIDQFTNGFGAIDFNLDIAKITPSDYRKENLKTVLAIAKVLATPIVIFRNVKNLIYVKGLYRNVTKFTDKVRVAFTTYSEEDKFEIYAYYSTLKETLSEVIETKKPNEKKGGYLTKAIAKQVIDLYEYVLKADEEMYKIAYPGSKDSNNPDFIKEVLEAHIKYNMKNS